MPAQPPNHYHRTHFGFTLQQIYNFLEPVNFRPIFPFSSRVHQNWQALRKCMLYGSQSKFVIGRLQSISGEMQGMIQFLKRTLIVTLHIYKMSQLGSLSIVFSTLNRLCREFIYQVDFGWILFKRYFFIHFIFKVDFFQMQTLNKYLEVLQMEQTFAASTIDRTNPS